MAPPAEIDQAHVRSVERTPVGHNLPSGLSNFLGREDQLAELRRLLRRARLVTLTGAPGIGKSRLGLELARQLAPGYADGVWLVALAPVGEGALVPTAVATALNVGEEPGKGLTDTLLSRLAGRRLLLVLDNCEHLLGACAELARNLLSNCPDVAIVATSREPLCISDEALYQVPALTLPDSAEPELVGACEAGRLFVERAAAVQRGFVLNAYVAPAVAVICRRLDGIPLAIELAAARVELLTPAEIARALDARFGLLIGGSRSALPHHSTLRAALDWSHEQLSEPERALLSRISVFAGGFSLEAAATVCTGEQVESDRVLELLTRLVSRSLVVAARADTEHPRYRLLETIRSYARDKLDAAGETSRLREAHARYHAVLAERAEPELTGPDQEHWFERLETERPNLRAALEWTLGHGQGELALRLAGALTLYWRVRCYFHEGRELLEAALAAGGDSSDSNDAAPADGHSEARLRAKALWGAGFMTLMTDDPDGAVPLLEDSHARFRALGDRQGCARALLLLGNCKQFQGGSGPSSLSLLKQSAALAREVGDAWCLAHALGIAGLEYRVRNELITARPLFEECLMIAREAEDKQGLRLGLLGLGEVVAAQGDDRLGETLLQEAVAVADELGEGYTKARALQGLGQLALERGDHARAQELLDEALALFREAAPPAKLVTALVVRARLASAEGECGHARGLLEEALTITQAGPDPSLSAQVLREMSDLAAEDDDAGRPSEEALELARARARRQEVAQLFPGSREPPRLTERERQVAELVAEGLTNREIAARLFISLGSVKDHLSHTFSKLGIARRAELAREISRGEWRRPEPEPKPDPTDG